MVTSTSFHEKNPHASTPNDVSKVLTHVLFIDDNKADNYVVNAHIKLDNIPIIPHFELNAIYAIDYLLKLNKFDFPHIIFVDFNMPLKDGFEFIEDFTRQFPDSDATIYIMSSSIRPSDREKIKNYDIIKDYLEKPVTADFLINLL